MQPARARHVKGAVLVNLVKLLRELQKTKPLPPLSPATQKFLVTRILNTEWYPLAPFQELLGVVDSLVLKGSEVRALEMGAAGATVQLQGVYKAYLKAGDAKESVYALRHAWGAQYDFGQLSAEVLDASVVFTLQDFQDISMVHGMMTVGWSVAAARVCGCAGVRTELLERPWRGGKRLRYSVQF